MSRLIDIDEDTQLPPEEQGYEFGYAVFEDLQKIKTFQVNEVIVGDKEIKNDPDLADALQCIDNPLSMERMKWIQEQDPDIQKLKHKLKHNKLDKDYYKMEDDLLKQKLKHMLQEPSTKFNIDYNEIQKFDSCHGHGNIKGSSQLSMHISDE